MNKNTRKLTTSYIINQLFERGLYYFDIRIFSYLFEITSNRASLWFKRLKEKGFIKEIENGKYLLLGFEPWRVLSEPFFIGTKVVIPSYVSFWSALNFYGFTEQIPRTIFIVSTKKKNDFIFEKIHFKYIKLSPRKFFGYREEKSGEFSYLIAEKEKSLIDSLDQSHHAGGIEEVFKSLCNAKGEINIKKFVNYAKRIGNKSLISRLGYFLDEIGIETKKLEQFKSKSYVKLDPRRKIAKIWNKKWRVNVNIPKDRLFEFRKIY